MKIVVICWLHRDTEIAKMWKCHYKSLLNSLQNEEFKKSVMLDINQQHETSIIITGCMLNGRPIARGECISSRASGTPVTTSPAGE